MSLTPEQQAVVADELKRIVDGLLEFSKRPAERVEVRMDRMRGEMLRYLANQPNVRIVSVIHDCITVEVTLVVPLDHVVLNLTVVE